MYSISQTWEHFLATRLKNLKPKYPTGFLKANAYSAYFDQNRRVFDMRFEKIVLSHRHKKDIGTLYSVRDNQRKY